MPTPVTAEYFQSHGVDATTASALAAAHNEAAGLRPSPAPILVEASAAAKPAPLNPAHEAKVAASAAELQKLGVDAKTAREVAEAELRYKTGSGVDRSVMLAELESGRTEGAIQASIDKAMEPASAPYQYLMPSSPETPEQHAFDTAIRNDMHAAGIPIESGNAILREVDEAARRLEHATSEERAAYAEKQNATLRRLWGSAYESRLKLAVTFVQDMAQRSGAVRLLLDQHPEYLNSAQVLDKVAQVAEYQSRIRRGAGR